MIIAPQGGDILLQLTDHGDGFLSGAAEQLGVERLLPCVNLFNFLRTR